MVAKFTWSNKVKHCYLNQETAKILNEQKKNINYLFKSVLTYFKALVNMRKSPIWVGSGNDFSKLLLRLKQSPAILQKFEIWIIIERIASGYINWNSKSWETWKNTDTNVILYKDLWLQMDETSVNGPIIGKDCLNPS